MLSFAQRLELLEQDLKADPPSFAMSADLPFAIFRYDPSHTEEQEWDVRREFLLLATRIEKATGKVVTVLPLSKLYWTSIEESEGIEEIVLFSVGIHLMPGRALRRYDRRSTGGT